MTAAAATAMKELESLGDPGKATIIDTIVKMVEDHRDDLVVILAGYLVLNFVVDNVIKPRFMQSGLDVSPLVGLTIETLLLLPLALAAQLRPERRDYRIYRERAAKAA
mgnify:CR=1 FL=1